MDNYKETLKYSYLNIAFKIVVLIAFILFIVFYFDLNIFNLKFFKTKNNKNNDYVYKKHDVNRELVNAISKENYNNKVLSDFFIKTAFNCCNIGYGMANVERLKTIISQGFRCLDFKLIHKNNTIHIENQPKNETFYNALEIINTHCFSNSYCNNNEDPLIINIRFDESVTNSLNESKIVFKKLREMFKTLNSNKLDDSYSVLQRVKPGNINKNILTIPLKDLQGNIIVMCNYNYDILEANSLDEEHNILQYIHFNTYIPKSDDTLNSISTILTTNKTYNNAVISMELNNIIKSDASDINGLINLNKTFPMMIIPNSSNNTDSVQNPSSLEDIFGYTFRSLEFSSIKDFKEDQIVDEDIKIYINEFTTASSAFILKPIKLRNVEKT